MASYGEYGVGPWYFDYHQGEDHQRNRYATRAERDEEAKKCREMNPAAKIVKGNDMADRRAMR